MKLQETRRKDGLRVITVSLPNQRKVYVELSARVGSAYDPEDKQGLFHFFEHMAFKGTKRRTVEDIQSFTQRNLLWTNAGTHSLSTRYQGVAVYTKMKEACDLLCDIYCNSIFPKEELEKERRPILLEIARNKDNDSRSANEMLRELLWEKNPMRLSGAGTVEDIKAVQRADILRERNRWHVPAATVAIAIGKVNHADFVREIYKNIPLNDKKVQYKSWSDEHEELPKKQRVVVKKSKREKAIVVLGFKVPLDLSDRTKDVLDCVESLLTIGSASRLWNEIREKRGLAYAVGGGSAETVGLGRYFYVYVETSPEHIAQVEALTLKALTEPLTNKIAFEEIRERGIDNATIGFDDNFGMYSALIWDQISRNKPVEDIVRYFSNVQRALKSITLEEVEATRKAFFLPEKFVTVVVLPR